MWYGPSIEKDWSRLQESAHSLSHPRMLFCVARRSCLLVECREQHPRLLYGRFLGKYCRPVGVVLCLNPWCDSQEKFNHILLPREDHFPIFV